MASREGGRGSSGAGSAGPGGADPGAPAPRGRLLDRVRERIRLKRYSIRTEQAYVQWVRRYVLFHGKRHPKEMGAPEVAAFLTHLALQRQVAAATQNQALNALVFLYREVLEQELGPLGELLRPRRPARLPVVLTEAEVRRLLGQLRGASWVAGGLMYGAGLRLMEVMRLRVKDVDLGRHEIVVRDGKGRRDRVTMLPEALGDPFARHLRRVQTVHESDLAEGFGAVYLPTALERKYPGASREWGWHPLDGLGEARAPGSPAELESER